MACRSAVRHGAHAEEADVKAWGTRNARGLAQSVVVAAAVAVVLSSCTSGGPPIAPPNQGNPLKATSISDLNKPSMTRIGAAELQQAMAAANDYQKDLLKDGSLTLHEYEKAELADVACLKANGYTVSPESPTLSGMAMFEFSVVGFRDPAAERKVANDCATKYISTISKVWAGVTAGIAQKTIAESRHFMAACLSQADVDVSQRPWQSNDPQITQVYSKCSAEDTQKFNTKMMFGVEGDENYRG